MSFFFFFFLLVHLHEVERRSRRGVCVDVINHQQGESNEQHQRSDHSCDDGRVLRDPGVVRSCCLQTCGSETGEVDG